MLGHTLFCELSLVDNVNLIGTIRGRHVESSILPKRIANKIKSGIDAANYNLIADLFQLYRPTLVINCIGLVKQLPAANDPLQAIAINALFPHQLAKLCHECGARLIHISTDCVFDGQAGNYQESDLPNATDLYGRTKFLGEVDYPHCITLRTSIIGHELGSQHGLVEWFLAQDSPVKGFTKAIFSGLPTIELARVIAEYVIPNENLSGLYHVSAEPISKYDLLNLIAKQYGRDIEIIPDGNMICDRSLNSELFRNLTGYYPPDWSELIRIMHTDWLSHVQSLS